MVHPALESLSEPLLRRLLQELGRQASVHRFEVAPNPCVGAAILAAGEIVGRGFHQAWGGPHAEREALAAAALSGVPASEWDTLVVTLEPCSSTGKTGPCVQAILEAGIPQVVVGALDPDPRHRGKGLEELRAAGVQVHLLEGFSTLEDVAPHFLSWNAPDRIRRPRPWTIAKWAQTRTGQLTPPEHVGEGRWITTPASLNEVQVLRGRVDAIVTGVGTVLADDPRLTVRPPGDIARAPRRIVLDTALLTPPDARLFAQPGPGEAGGPVTIMTVAGMDAPRARALQEAGAEIVGLHAGPFGHVALRDVYTWLWEAGVRRVMLECGPTLLRRHFDAEFVDQLRIYTGSVNGGRGPSMADSLQSIKLRERLDREQGEDAVLEAFVG
ncbi:MAG: bifunctional diaminohydroxyphosphoribosylaminopyrimidine deaminase/5-amino-6-(5-phosphoribosylamino)uracil reductase RibD [Planctomycetes bacterium]|nr:bifunctional diaminohydroxyphosphoribosylaminopyrimidine deaminase/5-amino-6-(5-phosphoribosylamino)uracil reductase RibD [Planctomycetota bacterium]MCB9904327.1 bifunctional diaminohydroxyphosphoribosylaminopyrimidine deaminase/5-amino-6-(5-phosphoribosylamino)uracil reductase RibD [Planctomycetota bacterium]